jgi:hypothetical protein
MPELCGLSGIFSLTQHPTLITNRPAITRSPA